MDLDFPHIIIEILDRPDDLDDLHFLTLLVENMKSRYQIEVQVLSERITEVLNREIVKEKRVIKFLDLEQFQNRLTNSLYLYDFFLNNFFRDEKGQLTHSKLVVPPHAPSIPDQEFETQTEKKNYLIAKYTTNLILMLRDYYAFVNRFVPFFESHYFFEEVEDGFLLFFERESDFEDYLFNIRTPKELAEFSSRKQIKFPEGLYEQLEKVVRDKMSIKKSKKE